MYICFWHSKIDILHIWEFHPPVSKSPKVWSFQHQLYVPDLYVIITQSRSHISWIIHTEQMRLCDLLSCYSIYENWQQVTVLQSTSWERQRMGISILQMRKKDEGGLRSKACWKPSRKTLLPSELLNCGFSLALCCAVCWGGPTPLSPINPGSPVTLSWSLTTDLSTLGCDRIWLTYLST